MSYRPLVISHAGCAGHAPENTLAAVRKAIELGADAVEVDVRSTNEGIPVVIHDATVDRTTGSAGFVHALDLADLKRLNAAANYPDWPTFEAIPTLEEVIHETRGKIRLVIEVKRPDIEGSVLEVIRMNGALEDVMIWSAHPQIVGQFRNFQPSIAAALLMGGETWSDLRQFLTEALWRNAQACSIEHSVLTPELAHEARLKGLGPFTWTVNEEAEMLRVLDCGVLGVVTDYPDRLGVILDAMP